MKRLCDEYPDEFTFFCQKFIWSSNHAGFYTRLHFPGSSLETPVAEAA
jgi:hypothetical protein